MLAHAVPFPRARLALALTATAAAAAAAGCGSASATELPPAAGPPRPQAPTEPPAGRVVRVGSQPEGVVADSETRLVAVALRDPDELALLDGATGRVKRRVPLPGAARHLGLAGPGGPVLAPAEGADVLAQVALPDGAITSTRVGASPHEAAAAGGRIFVADAGAQRLSVLKGERVVARVPVGLEPDGVTSLGRGEAIAVVSARERVVEVFDARTRRFLGRAPAGVGPTHVVSNDLHRLYVLDTAGNALLVFHLYPRLEMLRRLELPSGPYGLAIDLVRARLWVAASGANRLVEHSTGSRPRALRSFPTVRQPNSVAVDPRTGRVFVTGRADGVLQLLDPPPLRPRRP